MDPIGKKYSAPRRTTRQRVKLLFLIAFILLMVTPFSYLESHYFNVKSSIVREAGRAVTDVKKGYHYNYRSFQGKFSF